MSVFFRKEENIGYLEFNLADSKVNLLSSDVLKELDKVLDDIASMSELKALVIYSAKTNCFIAGADIKEIEKIVEPKDGAAKAKAGQDIMNKIEDLSIPTIAVIDGVCLGGGCELALSCQYRVSTFNEKVMIGLPEVRLGFIPGFGGTYRLPRIVDLQQALKMITTGSALDGKKALRAGLVDVLYPSKELMSFVYNYVEHIVEGKINKPRYKRTKKNFPVSFLDENRLGQSVVFSKAAEMAKGPYPAPQQAIATLKQTLHANRTKALQLEAKGFGELAITPISKSLVNIFYMNEKYKKLSVENAKDLTAKPIVRSGVLGAGIMGGGIAQLLSSKDIFCRLKDINHEAIGAGYGAAAKVYKQAVKRRKLTKAQAERKMAKITGTVDYSGFDQTDIVIEAVVEKMEVKQKVFKELSAQTKPDTILATNTSALSVKEMSKDVQNPERVIGIHFFNPVHRMPLIEVIKTEQTSEETIHSTLSLVKRLGKVPILCKDACGFVVNRILLAYINEAGLLLEETNEMDSIEREMLKFGMPMGPFTLSDEVGLDVGLKVLHILEEGLGPRYKAGQLFEQVFDKGLLGKKCGKGFFLHGGKKREANEEIKQILGSFGPFKAYNAQECVDRLILVMVNEASKILEEGVVDEADAIDVGMVFGTGFPPFKGGLLRYADSIGIDTVVNKLMDLKTNLKNDRFEPSNYLKELAAKKKSFFS